MTYEVTINMSRKILRHELSLLFSQSLLPVIQLKVVVQPRLVFVA